MDADRFDTLTRFVPTSGSRRRAMAVAVGGSLAAIGIHNTGAKKKKKRKGNDKEPCPTCICPAPTVCPAQDTCPQRTCCVCSESSGKPGCYLADIPSDHTTIEAVCVQICGDGAATWTQGRWPRDSSESVACGFPNDESTSAACIRIHCPL